MTRNNSPIRRAKERAVDFVQSPLGVGGATFTGISLIDLIAHLGPNGLLVASLAGIVAYSFKDEIFVGLSKATGRTIIRDDSERDDDEDEREQKASRCNEEKKAQLPPQVYHYDDLAHLIPANRI